MKSKAFCLLLILCSSSSFVSAQSPQPAHRTAKPWVLPSDPSFAKTSQRPTTAARTSISSCNNNGVCEPWLGDSCTTCADCVGDPSCAFLADVCSRYNFVGGKPGPVYSECLNDTYSNLTSFLNWFSKKYVAPGSNMVSDSSPLTPGDGKCNQFINAGSCNGVPTESCSNDPEDCGPCPIIANISDLNITGGTCDPTQCAKGVCAVGQCSVAIACQFNCDSAHYGGSYSGNPTYQSDAVDFSVTAATCSAMAALSDNLCGVAGTNYISYQQDVAGTLHVSINTRVGSFLADPDSSGVAGNACPSPNGGPPSFRAWVAGSAINNTLFTVGGGTCNTCSGFGGNEVRTVETYDTTSEAWYSKGMLQTARFGFAASAAKGKIYALGGTNSNQFLPIPSVEEYDPGTDLWSPKTTMPTPRWKVTASTVNGTIYTIGGGASGDQCAPTGIVEAYDPVANTWITTKKPMPTARWGAAADVLNGQIYVVGGSQSCPQGSVIVSLGLEAYDPSADAWSVKTPMSTPRWDLAAAAANGRFYAIGGWDPINQTALDVVEEFDPGTNSWITKSHMPTKRSGLTAVAINGKIHVFGGIDPFNRLLTTLEIYDPTTDTWTTATSLPVNLPSITLVSPTSGNQGVTIPNFTVVGSNIDPAAVLSFGGTGITVNSYSSPTPTQIVASITIASTAQPGAYDVVVTNPDSRQGKLPAGFTVFTPPPPTGTITVTTNIASATFTLTGPATLSGAGTSATFANAVVGTYTITFGPVAGYTTPSSQTQTLGAGGTIAFTGAYTPSRQITVSSIVGWNAGSAVLNAQWQGQPSGAPDLGKYYLFYAIDSCQEPGQCKGETTSVVLKPFWQLNGTGFCSRSGCKKGQKGTLAFSDTSLNAVLPSAIKTWTDSKIIFTPSFTPGVSFQYTNNPGVTMTITAPDGVSATVALPNPGGVVGTIATRGYGQCTWYVANQRLAHDLSIPVPAYQTTKSIDPSYAPQQWDVLNFTNQHSAIITSPITTTQVSQPNGNTVITYGFTIGEMNVVPSWGEQESHFSSTFAINVSRTGRKTILKKILSDYSTSIAATAYFR